jgi:hypothetical protein
MKDNVMWGSLAVIGIICFYITIKLFFDDND